MGVRLITILAATAIAVGCNQNQAGTPGNALAKPVNGAGEAGAAQPAAASDAASPAMKATEPAHEITIPAGTQLTVTLETPVGSDTSHVEEPVTAHLAHPIRLQGETVLAEGSRLNGVVTDATRSAKVKGRAHVALQFNALTPHGADQRYAIRTASIARTAEATKKKDALEIGAPAAGGALIGALVGGKKGALVGTAVGGGAGTAVVLSTRGKEVHIAKGTTLTLRLTAPVTVLVKG
jgi:hypothetical protein